MHNPLIALALLVFVGAAQAADCEQVIKADDVMKFDVKEISVAKSCKKFTVKLVHVGKLPKAAMGHNWILTRDADFDAVTKAAAMAGTSKDYTPADPRVIAHARLLGGGESDAATFDVSKLAAGNYSYFCSFPGHSAMMRGVLKLAR